MTGNINISFGKVLIILIALYFIIKWGVKNGINQSMLFSDEDRRKKCEYEMKTFHTKLPEKRLECRRNHPG